MLKTPFETIWSRIVAHAGETFHLKEGRKEDDELTYKIKGTGFYPSRTNYRISKANFEEVYPMVPIDGPGKIKDIVRGSSYVWAVLHDRRISRGEW